MNNNKPILISQPSLPDLDEFVNDLRVIWDNKWLTNNGIYHKEFEKKLANYLGVEHISIFSNGTLALISALQALRISGEVITTPFSFVATTHSLYWNNIKPVFVDVDPIYGNIDPVKIESAITPKTTAIMPVHVYGNPVEIERIEEIADTYGLKTIYDAAHAFGVKKDHLSILNHGDASILSFHATKAFNTIEGGAVIVKDEKTKKRLDYLKNFGFAGETKVIAPGINAKMNELQAAYGILQLKNINDITAKRKRIAEFFNQELKQIKGIRILEDMTNVDHNYSYYPIFVDKLKYGMCRDDLYAKLKENNIFGRRYFYPLISEFSTYKGLPSSDPENLKNASKLADEVICLPIFPELTDKQIQHIIKVIKSI